jgi:hypothetical protein
MQKKVVLNRKIIKKMRREKGYMNKTYLNKKGKINFINRN